MTVLLYGATGKAGKLLAQRLVEEKFGLILAGRHRVRLERLSAELGNLETRVAPAHDCERLAECIRGCTVVVNCAGPYQRLGSNIITAALDSGADYLDASNEQHFLRDVYERLDSSARKKKRAVLSGFGFASSIGDLAATLATKQFDHSDEPFDEVTVAYAVNAFRPSRGTQLSALSAISESGVAWVEDRWEAVLPAAEIRTVAIPAPFGIREALSFPGGEVITVPRHISAKKVQTFASLVEDSTIGRAFSRAAAIGSPLLPLLAKSPLLDLARAYVGANEPQRSDRPIAFSVVARAERSFARHQVSLSGTDLYSLNTEFLALAAGKLERREVEQSGVLTPSEVFDADDTLTAIATRCELSKEIK
jgi:short subunit dehydrogenase-like uncharacterized protein